MLRLCTIALDIVSSRTTARSFQREVARIQERRQEVLEIDRQACDHLRELLSCASVKDFLEHWNWRMHRSYIISELCRSMLAERDRHDETVRSLHGVCVEALTDTVDAFLNLHNITTFARTSWAAVHRSLSSALLLGIIKAPAKSIRVWTTLDRFITVMSNMELMDASEMPAPVSRAVAALMRLNVRDAGDNVSTGEYGLGPSEPEEESPHAQMQRILWGPSS